MVAISICMQNKNSIDINLNHAQKSLDKSFKALQRNTEQNAFPTEIYTASISEKNQKLLESNIMHVHKAQSMLQSVTQGLSKIQESITDGIVTVQDIITTMSYNQQIVKLDALLEIIHSTDKITSQVEFDRQKLIYKPFSSTNSGNSVGAIYSIDELNQQLENVEQSIAEKESELVEINASIGNVPIDEQIAAKEERLAEVNSDIVTKETEITNIIQEIATLTTQIKDAENTILILSSERIELLEQIAYWEAEYDRQELLRDEASVARSHEANLWGTASGRYSAEVNRLNNDLNNGNISDAEFDAQIDLVNEEYDAARDRYDVQFSLASQNYDDAIDQMGIANDNLIVLREQLYSFEQNMSEDVKAEYNTATENKASLEQTKQTHEATKKELEADKSALEIEKGNIESDLEELLNIQNQKQTLEEISALQTQKIELEELIANYSSQPSQVVGNVENLDIAFIYSYAIDLQNNRDEVKFLNLEKHALFGKVREEGLEEDQQKYLSEYISQTKLEIENLINQVGESTEESVYQMLKNIEQNLKEAFSKIGKERLTQESQLQSVERNLSPMESSLAHAQETYNRYMQVDTVEEVSNINDKSNALGLNLYLFEVDRDNSKQIVRSLGSS